MSLKDTTQTLITLTVAENQVLFIMLADDGAINRMGDGSPDCKERILYMGITKEKIMDQLRENILPDMENFLHKTYDLPDKKGRPCELKILFKVNGIETGVQFHYGELSQGPPTVFRNYCIRAIELTEIWFREQKQVAANSKQQRNPVSNKSEEKLKPWWKFW